MAPRRSAAVESKAAGQSVSSDLRNCASPVRAVGGMVQLLDTSLESDFDEIAAFQRRAFGYQLWNMERWRLVHMTGLACH
jgi:hypothetical protein